MVKFRKISNDEVKVKQATKSEEGIQLDYKGFAFCRRKKNERQKKLKRIIDVYRCVKKGCKKNIKRTVDDGPLAHYISAAEHTCNHYLRSKKQEEEEEIEKKKFNMIIEEIQPSFPNGSFSSDYPRSVIILTFPLGKEVNKISVWFIDLNDNRVLCGVNRIDYGSHPRTKLFGLVRIEVNYPKFGNLNGLTSVSIHLQTNHNEKLETVKHQAFDFINMNLIYSTHENDPPKQVDPNQNYSQQPTILGKRSRDVENKSKSRKLPKEHPNRIYLVHPNKGIVSQPNYCDIYFSVSRRQRLEQFQYGDVSQVLAVHFQNQPAKLQKVVVPYRYFTAKWEDLCSKNIPNIYIRDPPSFRIPCFVPIRDERGFVNVTLSFYGKLVETKINGYEYIGSNESKTDENSVYKKVDDAEDEENNMIQDTPPVDFNHQFPFDEFQEEPYFDVGGGGDFPDDLDIFGANILFYAIAKNQKDVFFEKSLSLEEKDKNILKKRDAFGISLFEVAMYYERKEIFDYLLEREIKETKEKISNFEFEKKEEDFILEFSEEEEEEEEDGEENKFKGFVFFCGKCENDVKVNYEEKTMSHNCNASTTRDSYVDQKWSDWKKFQHHGLETKHDICRDILLPGSKKFCDNEVCKNKELVGEVRVSVTRKRVEIFC